MQAGRCEDALGSADDVCGPHARLMRAVDRKQGLFVEGGHAR